MRKINENNGILKILKLEFSFPFTFKIEEISSWKHWDNNLIWHWGWGHFYSLSLCLENWLKLSLFSRSSSKDSIGGAKIKHFSFFQSPCQIGLYTWAQNVCPGRPVYEVKCLCSREQEWGREGCHSHQLFHMILMTWRACEVNLVMIQNGFKMASPQIWDASGCRF